MTISWIKSFKDVYQKFIRSAQKAREMVRNGQSNLTETEFEMPCFYLRNNSFMAVFKFDTLSSDQDMLGSIEAVIKPSLNLERKIIDSKCHISSYCSKS